MIVLAAATGLRSGELLGLTVDRIDFLRRGVSVEQQLVYIAGQAPFMGPPKMKASRRVVPVPTFALDELAAHLAAVPPGENGLVFHSVKTGGPVLRTTLHGRWRRTLRRAGMPETTRLHHLRHHYASVPPSLPLLRCVGARRGCGPIRRTRAGRRGPRAGHRGRSQP